MKPALLCLTQIKKLGRLLVLTLYVTDKTDGDLSYTGLYLDYVIFSVFQE